MSQLERHVNRCSARLIDIASRRLPGWSKPPLRRLLAVQRRMEWAFRRLGRRLRPPPLPINADGKVYIHLGCGPIDAPGFINVDAVPYKHVHYVQEVKHLSIFSDGYADLIYASHVLEHISHTEVAEVLREWRRVLKEGGVLRISVPDFDKLLITYSAEAQDISAIIGPLMGGQSSVYDYHKIAFNERYLTQLLLSAGFKAVRHWDPAAVELHAFEDWASRALEIGGKRYWISLNLEGVK